MNRLTPSWIAFSGSFFATAPLAVLPGSRPTCMIPGPTRRSFPCWLFFFRPGDRQTAEDAAAASAWPVRHGLARRRPRGLRNRQRVCAVEVSDSPIPNLLWSFQWSVPNRSAREPRRISARSHLRTAATASLDADKSIVGQQDVLEQLLIRALRPGARPCSSACLGLAKTLRRTRRGQHALSFIACSSPGPHAVDITGTEMLQEPRHGSDIFRLPAKARSSQRGARDGIHPHAA